MALWSAFYPDLTPKVPGCPNVVVVHELRRAAQVFFEGTRAWRVRLSAATVAANTDTVVLAPATGQEIVRVEVAWCDGIALAPLVADEMDKSMGSGWADQTGTPNSFFEDTPGSLRLYPIPAAAAVTGVTALVSVRPSEAATGIPDALVTKFREELIFGALERLLGYSNKPWTDIPGADRNAKRFQAGIDAAAAQAAVSFGRGRITSRPSFF